MEGESVTPAVELLGMDGLMDAKELGMRLAELRRAAGYSRAALAELADVNARTLEGWEQGRFDPPAIALFRIADILKVPVDSFKVEKRPRRKPPPQS